MEREQHDLQGLVLRLADGDRTAFDPLYEALWPLVSKLAQRMLPGAHDAEDAAQEAMMKLFARASHFDPERDVRAWVLGITAYECKTVRQKQRRRRESSAAAPHIDPRSSPEAEVIARDLEAAALAVLGSLRPVDVETLRAVIAGDRPELPQPTFRKRASRALSRLRAAWSSRHGAD